MNKSQFPGVPIMAVKLQEAGVVATVPNRGEVIWRIVKERTPHGGVTSTELVRRLHAVPPGTISSVLAKMEQRGMIYSRGTKGNGPTGTMKQYLTDMQQYELLPAPKHSKANTKPAKSRNAGNVQPSSPPSPVANQQVAPPPAADPAQVTDQLIEHLTIAQARALHKKLERMFSAKN